MKRRIVLIASSGSRSWMKGPVLLKGMGEPGWVLASRNTASSQGTSSMVTCRGCDDPQLGTPKSGFDNAGRPNYAQWHSYSRRYLPPRPGCAQERL